MQLLRIRHLVSQVLHESTPHAHAEGQVFTVQSGLVSVVADNQRWVMPPGCLGWVPPHVMHGATTQGDMLGMSLYVEEHFSHARMPQTIKVVRSTSLLSALLEEFVQSNPPQLTSYMDVFADAFTRQPAQMFYLPIPQDPRLSKLAMHLSQQPDDDSTLDVLATLVGMSERTLARKFQQETGLTLGVWRQQMRLLLAIERLAAGGAVTTVALDMGYQSVSAFIAMFRRYLGMTPKAWFG